MFLKRLINTRMLCESLRMSEIMERNMLLFLDNNFILHSNTNVGSKFVHTSYQLNKKEFKETENQYAHSIIKKSIRVHFIPIEKLNHEYYNIKSYEELCNILNQDWKNESTSQIVRMFKTITEYSQKNGLSLSHNIFDNFVVNLLSKCRQLTDEEIGELLIILQNWPEAHSVNSHNFCDVWSALDDMCLERIKNWDFDKMIYFADLWYQLNLAKVSDFVWQAIRRLTRKPSRLSPKHLVQTMFLINVCRKSTLTMYDLENRLRQCIDELSLNELGVVSLGFFKSQTSLKDISTIAKLIQRLTEEVNSVHEITLCAVMKIIRYSKTIHVVDQLTELLDKLVPEIDRLSLLSCLHVALVGTNALLFHEKSLSKISEKFSQNLQQIRLKDIERYAFLLSLYDFKPNVEVNMLEEISKELYKRGEEILRYPRSLSCCLHYLSIGKVYPEDLISRVLDPTFIKSTYGSKWKIGRELFSLDSCLDIDVPNYSGNRLDKNIRSSTVSRFISMPPSPHKSLNVTDRIMLELKESLIQLQGSDFVQTAHVLPHFERADYIICNDRNGNPVNIKCFFQVDLSNVKYVPKQPDLQWYAFVVGGWNMLTRNSNLLLGTTKMKLEQLQTIGYTPILVPWTEWIKIPNIQRLSYLQEKINNEIVLCRNKPTL